MLICLNFIGHVNTQLEKNHINLIQIYFFFFFQFFNSIFSFNFPTISLKINFIFRHSSLFFFPNPEHSSLFFPQTQDSPLSLPISYSSLNHWCLCHLSFSQSPNPDLMPQKLTFLGFLLLILLSHVDPNPKCSKSSPLVDL